LVWRIRERGKKENSASKARKKVAEIKQDHGRGKSKRLRESRPGKGEKKHKKKHKMLKKLERKGAGGEYGTIPGGRGGGENCVPWRLKENYQGPRISFKGKKGEEELGRTKVGGRKKTDP